MTHTLPFIGLSVNLDIGVPRERQESIFDPFVQVARGHTRRSDGSGLGLTLSRRLARLMRGDIGAMRGKFPVWTRGWD